jgi:hypothetical protein
LRRTDYVPLASPVLLQGVITIVLLILTLGMIGGAIAVAVHYVGGEPPPGETAPQAPRKANPYRTPKVKGPSVAGDVPLKTPVIYCIDAGGSMADLFDYAAAITYASIRTLGSDGTFSVMVVREDGVVQLPGGYQAGGEGGVAAARVLLSTIQAHGATARAIPRALTKAVEQKPAELVFFAAKRVDAEQTAAAARRRGVPITTIALGQASEAAEGLKRLAEATGGRSREFTAAELAGFDLRPGPPETD